MTLPDWERNGWLTRHASSPQEIGELLAIADRDIADAAGGGMSLDWQFGIAYNAVLKLCTILLHAEGYRVARVSHHYHTIAALPLILGSKRSRDATYLNRCREKRNAAEYDRVGTITEAEVREIIAFARDFRVDVAAWLTRHHSEFPIKTGE